MNESKGLTVEAGVNKIKLIPEIEKAKPLTFTLHALIYYPPLRAPLFELIRQGGQLGKEIQDWFDQILGWKVIFYPCCPPIQTAKENELWSRLKRIRGQDLHSTQLQTESSSSPKSTSLENAQENTGGSITKSFL
jgi:hypothetical protein